MRRIWSSKLPLPLSSGIWSLQDPPDTSFVLRFVFLTPAFLLTVFYWGSAKKSQGKPGRVFDMKLLPSVFLLLEKSLEI